MFPQPFVSLLVEAALVLTGISVITLITLIIQDYKHNRIW